MSKIKLMLVMMTGVVALGVAAVAMAGVPAGKEVLKIELLPVKQGAVTFAHAKHATEFKKADGAAITCKDCHHTLAAAEPAAGEAVKSCDSCHAKDGVAKTVDGKQVPPVGTLKDGKAEMKSVIFHKTCLDCHKAMKAAGKNIAGCTTCHKK